MLIVLFNARHRRMIVAFNTIDDIDIIGRFLFIDIV